MKKHKHRAEETKEIPFFGPVAARENKAAHGSVCVVDTCRCGMVRRSNRNGQHVERGPWAYAVRRVSFTRFGVSLCPPEADWGGLITYRENFEKLPPAEWTSAEKWIHMQEQRIAAWRREKRS